MFKNQKDEISYRYKISQYKIPEWCANTHVPWYIILQSYDIHISYKLKMWMLSVQYMW